MTGLLTKLVGHLVPEEEKVVKVVTIDQDEPEEEKAALDKPIPYPEGINQDDPLGLNDPEACKEHEEFGKKDWSKEDEE